MRVEPTEIPGVSLTPGRRTRDSRGSFTKALDGAVSAVQLCAAHNLERGTVRGLHVQVEPYSEEKRVWCVAGSVWDVLVDTRPDEPTYGSWTGLRLDATKPLVLGVPAGVAHGYQSLVDETVVVYLIAGPYSPAHARTISWSDPTLNIDWPLPVSRISDADRDAPPWPLAR